MATVEEIKVEIRGELDDINKKLDKLDRQINNTTTKASQSFKRLATAAKAFIGAIVVQQTAKATISLAQFSGDIDELKSKSAAVFKEFTNDVRQELAAFGDAVGRSTHELEGMAAGVQDTFVPLGFARGEAAKLSTSLTKLAVDTASFNNANDVETMNAFKSALVGNHEAVRRFGIVITETELKAELFRMGITKNANEVDAQTKVQARLNLITKGLGDAQGDATRTADSFANRQRALRSSLEEVGDEIGLALQPSIASLTETLIGAVDATRNFLLTIGLATPRLDSQRAVIQELNRLAIERNSLQEKQDKAFIKSALITQRLAEIESERNDLSDRLRAMQITEMDVKNKIKDQKETEKLEQKSLKYEEALKKIKNENGEIVKLLDMRKQSEIDLHKFIFDNMPKDIELTAKQREEMELQLSRLKANKDMFDKRNQSIERAKSLVQDSITEETHLSEAIKTLDFALREGAISGEDHARATKMVREEMRKLGEELPPITELQQTFISVTDTMANKFESSFIDAITGTKSALESFKDFSRQLVQEILRTYVRLSIINPIINRIFQGNVAGFEARQTASPQQVMTNFMDIGKRAFGGAAGGGTIQGKRPVIVGERGPEMFIPNVGGRIVPNGALPSGGGGTVINQSLNFATGIQNTVRAEVMNMMPIIQNATLQAVVDQKRRGGAFAQGMG